MLINQLLDNELPTVFENEEKYQGARQRMALRFTRGKSPVVSLWEERPGGSGRDNWSIIDNKICGHIRKYIGKKFDDCFSDFKQKCLTNKDWQLNALGFGSRSNKKITWFAWRNRFLSLFEPYRWRWAPAFEVIDGIIREVPTCGRQRSRDIVYYGEGEHYYRVNLMKMWNVRHILEELPTNFIPGMLETQRVSVEDRAKMQYEFASTYINKDYPEETPNELVLDLTRKRWNFKNIFTDYFLELVDTREKIVVREGTPEWKRLNTQRKAKKPNLSDMYDKSLRVQKYINKHPEDTRGFHELMKMDI